MKANGAEMIQMIVAISVAVIVFSLILIPMLGAAENQTVDGEAHTENVTGYATGLIEYAGTDDIEIDVTLFTATNDYTLIVTSTMAIIVDKGVSVTVYDVNGKNTSPSEDITITASSKPLVNTASNPTYGYFTSFSTLKVDEDVTLTVWNDATFAKEKVNGSKIELTSTAVENQKGIYAVSAVDGTNGVVVAPLTYTYYDQVPAVNDNLKAILDVLPYLVAIGIILAAVALFIKKGGY